MTIFVAAVIVDAMKIWSFTTEPYNHTHSGLNIDREEGACIGTYCQKTIQRRQRNLLL